MACECIIILGKKSLLWCLCVALFGFAGHGYALHDNLRIADDHSERPIVVWNSLKTRVLLGEIEAGTDASIPATRDAGRIKNASAADKTTQADVLENRVRNNEKDIEWLKTMVLVALSVTGMILTVMVALTTYSGTAGAKWVRRKIEMEVATLRRGATREVKNSVEEMCEYQNLIFRDFVTAVLESLPGDKRANQYLRDYFSACMMVLSQHASNVHNGCLNLRSFRGFGRTHTDVVRPALHIALTRWRKVAREAESDSDRGEADRVITDIEETIKIVGHIQPAHSQQLANGQENTVQGKPKRKARKDGPEKISGSP
jgi:hypothetical protein